MDKAKLFINGRSQAVRLPKKYRFEGNEVYIKQIGSGVLLIQKDGSFWESWMETLKQFDGSFMEDRNQPAKPEQRKGLDEVFT